MSENQPKDLDFATTKALLSELDSPANEEKVTEIMNRFNENGWRTGKSPVELLRHALSEIKAEELKQAQSPDSQA